MPRKGISTAAYDSGNLLSQTDKAPSPDGNRGGKRRTRKRLDKRLAVRPKAATSREGSLLAIDELLDKPRPTRRSRSPVSGTKSSSPRITSPRLTSPLPEPQIVSGLPISSVSLSQEAKLREATSSPHLHDHWSLQKEHADGSSQFGTYDEELALAKKVARVVGTVAVVSAAVAMAIFLLWKSAFIWRAEALEDDLVRHFCASQECERAMSRIRTSELRSADPCTDFYQYACGRWTPLDSEGRARDYLDESFRNYTNNLIRLIEREENGTLRWSSGSIRNFYHSCFAFMATARPAFFNDTLAELNIVPRFWAHVQTIDDLTTFIGKLCMQTGLPSFVNVTTRNAILQIDVGTTLAASLAPFDVSAIRAVSFVCGELKPDFNNTQKKLLDLDAKMESYREQFDRGTHFRAHKYKNSTAQLASLYEIAMNHADGPTLKIMEGTILVRGLKLIDKMTNALIELPFGLAAFYCYMVAASKMIGFELQRQQPYLASRENTSNRCLHAVLEHYGSGFLHWAASYLQSRFAVDAARTVAMDIMNQYLRMAPPSVVNDFRAVNNATSFHFYANNIGDVKAQAAKINTPYTRDNFLRNLVLHARSPTRHSALWSPFQHFATLTPLGNVVRGRHLYLVFGPMYLMEDFFYPDASEISLNHATLGGYMASEIMAAMEHFDAPEAIRWKQKVEACHRANAKLLGWDGAAHGEEEMDYAAALRLSVAFGAASQKDPLSSQSKRLFFQRFALTSCAINASRARRLQVNYAVRHVPEFAAVFNCKPSGFTPCHV